MTGNLSRDNPYCSPAVIEALKSELDDIGKVDFTEPSSNLYSNPVACNKILIVPFVTIDFRMGNKNMINEIYPMHRVKDSWKLQVDLQYSPHWIQRKRVARCNL